MSTVTLEKMRPDDARHVVMNLWGRGIREIEKYGVTDKEQLVTALIAMSKEYGFAIWHKSIPMAVFGAHFCEEDNIYYTWFAATEAFTEAGKETTKLLKKFVRDRIKERPGVEVEIWSAVDHPDAPRWFQLLGFKPLPIKDENKKGYFSRYQYCR